MLKQKVVALCATVAMSSAVLADDLSIQPVSNAFDESKVFELAPNQQLKAVELSETEMKETEGEYFYMVVPLVNGIIGGTGGYIGYTASCRKHDDCDPRAEAGAFWGGFAAGAIGLPLLGPAVGGYIGNEMSR